MDKIPNISGDIGGDGCPPKPDLPKSTPELVLDTGKDIAKTLGILLLIGPKVISESGILEFIDWRLKNDNCPQKDANKRDNRDPESSIYKVEKDLKDGLKAAEKIVAPIGNLVVNTLPIKTDVKTLLNLLENDPCHFIDKLKLILVTPGGNEAFIIRHFMAKLKKIVNYLKESSKEELEQSESDSNSNEEKENKKEEVEEELKKKGNDKEEGKETEASSPTKEETAAPKPVPTPPAQPAQPAQPAPTSPTNDEKHIKKGGSNTVSSETISPEEKLAMKTAINNGSTEINEKDIETALNTLEGNKKKKKKLKNVENL